MSLACKHFLLIFGTLGTIWILSLAFFDTAMDSLDAQFTIEIGGASIANIAGHFESHLQARTGSQPAVFTLKEGRLSSGDYILGRSASEDRSFLPKAIFWFNTNKGEDLKVQPVTAQKRGDSYQLIFTGAGLIVQDGHVFADLSGNDESKVILKMMDGSGS